MVVGMVVVQFDLECTVAFARKGTGIGKGLRGYLVLSHFLLT